MEFPKQFMTISQLVQMGMSETFLRSLVTDKGYPLCFREGMGRTSPIKFDTHELQKLIKRNTQVKERR